MNISFDRSPGKAFNDSGAITLSLRGLVWN